jgi:hypothetical protein
LRKILSRRVTRASAIRGVELDGFLVHLTRPPLGCHLHLLSTTVPTFCAS